MLVWNEERPFELIETDLVVSLHGSIAGVLTQVLSVHHLHHFLDLTGLEPMSQTPDGFLELTTAQVARAVVIKFGEPLIHSLTTLGQ